MNRLTIDKFYHFIAGWMINITLLLYLYAFDFSKLSAFLILICVPVLAGILKEVFDKLVKKSTPEWLDMVATVAGGWLVAFSLIF